MDELTQLREQINELDQKMIELLSERFGLVEQVGGYKAKNSLSVYQVDQWSIVLKRAKERGKQKKLPASFVEQIWKAIHKQALFLQYKQKGMYISPKIKTEE